MIVKKEMTIDKVASLNELAKRNSFLERFGERPTNWQEKDLSETFNWALVQVRNAVVRNYQSDYDSQPANVKSHLARGASSFIQTLAKDETGVVLSRLNFSSVSANKMGHLGECLGKIKNEYSPASRGGDALAR